MTEWPTSIAAPYVASAGVGPLLRGSLAIPEAVVWPMKDPIEVRPYGIDFADELPPGDTLTSAAVLIGSAQGDPSTWSAPVAMAGGIVPGTIATSGSTAIVWFSGGADAVDYLVLLTVAAASGATLRRAAVLPVRAQFAAAAPPPPDGDANSFLLRSGAVLLARDGRAIIHH